MLELVKLVNHMTIFDAFIGLFHLQRAKVGWKKGEKDWCPHAAVRPERLPSSPSLPFPALPFPACLPALPASPASFYSTLNPIIMSMVWPNSKIEVQVSTFDSLGTWAAARVRRSRCAVLCVGQSPSNQFLWWASFVKPKIRQSLI